MKETATETEDSPMAMPAKVRSLLRMVSDEAEAVAVITKAGYTEDDAQRWVREWQAERAAESGWQPSPLDFDFDAVPEPPDWIVDRVIERGTVVVLSGDTGAAKSIVTSSLVQAALAGEDWIGHICAIDRVMVIDEENPDRLARSRLRALGVKNAMRDRLRYYSREGVAVADEGRSDDWLRAQLAEFEPDLVVIDTLMSSCAVEDTNSNSEAVRVMKHLRGLAREFGCAILLMHHERKRAVDDTRSSGQAMMGARQWAGQADAHLTLTVESDFTTEPAETDGHELTRRTFKWRPAEKDRDGRENGTRRLAVTSERDERGRYLWMKVSNEGPIEDEGAQDVMKVRILGVLAAAEGEGIVATGTLAAALGVKADDGSFKRALSALTEECKIDKPSRGHYRLTDRGRVGLPLAV